jgi:hypothetical protein
MWIESTLTPYWNCGSGNTEIHFIKFGMNPHQDTRTGDEAMTTLE